MGGIMKQNAIVEKMLEVVIKNQATEIALLKEQILLLKQQNLRLAQLHEAQISHWSMEGTWAAERACEMGAEHQSAMNKFKESEAKAKEEITAEANRAKKEATELYLGR